MKMSGRKCLLTGSFLLLAALLLGFLLPRLVSPLWNRVFAARESAQLAQIITRVKGALGAKKGILTRAVSAVELDSLSGRVGARVTLHPLNDLPPDFSAARAHLKKNVPLIVMPLNADGLAGYVVLRGASGIPDSMLSAELPRPGLQSAQRVLQNSGLIIGGLGFILFCSGVWSVGMHRYRTSANRPSLFVRPVEEAVARPNTAPAAGSAHDTSSDTSSTQSMDIHQVRQELESTRARLKESEETYRQMALNASDVLYAMYPEAGRIEWLGQIDLMLGYAHGSFPRTIEAWADSIHPDEAENIIALYTRACEMDEDFQIEYRMRHRNGSYRDWSHRGKPVFGPRKKLIKLVGACTDITDKKRAENRVRASEERLNRIVETVAEAIVMVDREGIVTFANPAVELVFGANKQDIVGTSYADARWNITQTDGAPFPPEELPYVRALSTEESVFGIEHALQHASGQIVVVSVNAALLRNEHGEISGCILSLADITDRKANEDRLMFQAFHDPLTKLPNRALFVDRLGHALVRCKRSKTMVAVFFIDLDNFKKTNDTLGHDAGDSLLIETAARILASIRAGDTGARLAGDEFTIMLDNITNIAQALVVANRLLENMIQPVTLKGEEVYAPPSIGVALGNQDDDPDSIMKRADAMMYQAKKNGKARYEVSPHLVSTTESVA